MGRSYMIRTVRSPDKSYDITNRSRSKSFHRTKGTPDKRGDTSIVRCLSEQTEMKHKASSRSTNRYFKHYLINCSLVFDEMNLFRSMQPAVRFFFRHSLGIFRMMTSAR